MQCQGDFLCLARGDFPESLRPASWGPCLDWRAETAVSAKGMARSPIPEKCHILGGDWADSVEVPMQADEANRQSEGSNQATMTPSLGSSSANRSARHLGWSDRQWLADHRQGFK